MVIRGKLRGNGSQLAGYLLKKADNDNVRLLVIEGTVYETDLHKSLIEMSLTSELTKSDKGLYHVQICPAYGEDKSMTDDDWKKAADILENETGYAGQKRAIVLHDKKGKIHAHVVWERYSHDKEIMLPDSFSRLAQNRARLIMEQEFKHHKTQERNSKRPEMKSFLSNAWRETDDANSFVGSIKKEGYTIAAGRERPYIVVDENGRSFDLVRHLDKIKTKEVRERFKNTKLLKEKEEISAVRTRQAFEKSKRSDLKTRANENISSITVDRQRPNSKEAKKTEILEQLKKERLKKAQHFRENERDL